MWCPQCGAEYKRGIKTCVDCSASLVKYLRRVPPEQLGEGAKRVLAEYGGRTAKWALKEYREESTSYYNHKAEFKGRGRWLLPLVFVIALLHAYYSLSYLWLWFNSSHPYISEVVLFRGTRFFFFEGVSSLIDLAMLTFILLRVKFGPGVLGAFVVLRFLLFILFAL